MSVLHDERLTVWGSLPLHADDAAFLRNSAFLTADPYTARRFTYLAERVEQILAAHRSPPAERA